MEATHTVLANVLTPMFDFLREAFPAGPQREFPFRLRDKITNLEVEVARLKSQLQALEKEQEGRHGIIFDSNKKNPTATELLDFIQEIGISQDWKDRPDIPSGEEFVRKLRTSCWNLEHETP